MHPSGNDDAAATNGPPDSIDAHATSTEWRGPAPVFYRIDLAKITRAEYGASLSPLKTLWALLLLRVLRVKAPASADDPAVDSLAPFMTPSLRASGPVKDQFDAMAAELASAGFHSPVCYAIDDYFHSTGTVLMCFAHRHLPIMARLHLRVWAFKNPPAAALFTAVEAVEGAELDILIADPDDGMKATVSHPAHGEMAVIRRSMAEAGMSVTETGTLEDGGRIVSDITIGAGR